MRVCPDGDPKSSTQSKISQFDGPLLVDEQILGLEVTMKHSPGVTEHYALQNLVCVALDGGEGQVKRYNYLQISLHSAANLDKHGV